MMNTRPDDITANIPEEYSPGHWSRQLDLNERLQFPMGNSVPEEYPSVSNTVELTPTLGALSPRGGPVQDPVTVRIRSVNLRSCVDGRGGALPSPLFVSLSLSLFLSLPLSRSLSLSLSPSLSLFIYIYLSIYLTLYRTRVEC